jgi:hypothetical protein
MEKKIIYRAEFVGSEAVLSEMSKLRAKNAELTNEQQVYNAAAKAGVKITDESKVAYEKNSLEIARNKKEMSELAKNYEGVEQKAQGLRPRLTELNKALQEMAASGKRGSKEFVEMRNEAARLRDQIDKTNAEVKYFSDDLAGLKAGVSALQGVSAGFQAVTGIMAIAGVESEQFEKMLLKVQGAMAVTNSLQQVSNLLRKEGAIRLGALSLATKVNAVATGIATAATTAWTVSAKALTSAIHKIPIVGWILAAVSALIALIAHWDKVVAGIKSAVNWLMFWKKASKEAETATDAVAVAVENLSDQLERKNRLMADGIDSLQHEIKLMKAQGKGIDEIKEKEQELLEQKIEQARLGYEMALRNNELTAKEREVAKQKLYDAQRELQYFIENEQTKTRVAREQAAQREKDRREKEMIEEIQYLNDLNTQYKELELTQEEERRLARVAAYEQRKAERQQQRDKEKQEREAVTNEYNNYLDEQRRAELSDFDIRAEMYQRWLDKKAISQSQFDALMKKRGEDMLVHQQQMQAMSVASSLASSGQLVQNIGMVLEAESKAAKFAKLLAIGEAAVNFGVGVSATMRKGYPIGLPFVLSFLAQAAGIVAQIKSAVVPAPPKLAKGGIIGGHSHSAGGTMFRGSDGSMFEAERGEYLAVVNKKDAKRAAMLDMINRDHGLPFGAVSGYFARGGVQMPSPRSDFERTNTDDIIRQTVNAITAIPVVVSEGDISETQRRVAVYEQEGNL